MTKKKKRELTLQEMMIRDAGAGFENLRIVLRQNYEFLANRDVKNFKDLKKFLSKSNITPKEAAAAIARHVRHGSNWTEYQIRRAKYRIKIGLKHCSQTERARNKKIRWAVIGLRNLRMLLDIKYRKLLKLFKMMFGNLKNFRG